MDLKKTCNNALLALLLATVSVTASAQLEILDPRSCSGSR